MAVRDSPDDVLGPERRIATKKDLRVCGLHRGLVDDRHVPFRVEPDADVALDPWERIFLTDGDQHVVAFEVRIGLAGRDELPASLRVAPAAHLLERHADQLAVAVLE